MSEVLVQQFYDHIASNLSCPAELGRILSRMVADGAVATYFDTLLDKIVSGIPIELRMASSASMLLHSGAGFSVQARRVGNRRRPRIKGLSAGGLLATPGTANVAVFADKTPLQISEYRESDSGRYLSPVRTFLYASEALHEDPLEPIVRAYHCDGHTWMIRINIGTPINEIRYYSQDTLKFMFNSAVKGESSSFVTLCEVLAATGDANSLPYLKELSTNEAYFVRWAAIQAIGKIDGSIARQMLQRAIQDPHPAIKFAAAKALSSLGVGYG